MTFNSTVGVCFGIFEMEQPSMDKFHSTTCFLRLISLYHMHIGDCYSRDLLIDEVSIK